MACGDDTADPGDVGPIAANARIEVTLAEDTVASIDPEITDADTASLVFSASAPSHGAVSITGSTITYTPAANYAGTDTFRVTASDGTSTAEVEVAITVTPVNDAPVATAGMASTNRDEEVAFTLAGTDVDGDALTFAITAQPAHGTIEGTAPALTYVPAPGYFGTDELTFTASDGTLTSAPAKVTFTVGAVVTCGDGITEGAEACDDGNDVDTDACTNGCTIAACGDGIVQAGVEPCDDGNDVDDDACTNACALPTCGDGIVQAPEECDDMNADDTDACRNNCVEAFCGDGVVQAGEACDDMNADDTDACLTTCVIAVCGDGAVQAGVEPCDDGNAIDTDACRNDCTVAICGDGVVQAGVEECDDANVIPDDGCSNTCRAPACGDGVTQLGAGESCDDGNVVAGDGCSATCAVEPFVTTAPVRVNDVLACTTATANAAAKIAVDGSGVTYAGMVCGTEAYVVISRTRGASFTLPLSMSADLPNAPVVVANVGVAATSSGTAYVAIMLNTGEVYLRSSNDAGMTWSAPNLVGQTINTSSGLSVRAFNGDVFVGFAVSGGVAVARNPSYGIGPFETTSVGMSIAFFDLLYDFGSETLALCADTPGFHVRTSADGGVNFANEVNPPGQEYYSDWAAGGGQFFAVGTNLGSLGDSNRIYRIPGTAPTTSTAIFGLPPVSTAQSRTVAANNAGDAFVASQLDGGAIQLDRLPAASVAFDAIRTLAPAGSSPVVAALPGTQGAAVEYTVGTDVWVTIQAY